MSDSTTPVIVSAVRTPIGRYLGGLSSFTAPQLGAMVIREAVRRAGVDANLVDEVIMGQVVQGGSGQAPARQALIHAGLPASIPALTINKVCGSGLKAVMLAAQAVKAGDAECIVAGGQEAMSSAPHYVYGMRGGIKAGNQTMVDGMIHDGLWDSFGCCHMGEYAEYTAEKAGVSRADQDAFAKLSQDRAVAAQDSGFFAREITPITRPDGTVVDRDDCPRPGTTLEGLAGLDPAFRPEDGSVTAGNSCPLNDGAAAVVVMSRGRADDLGIAPLARIVASSVSGNQPELMGVAPIDAIPKALAAAGAALSDIDVVELNEAFAAQVLPVCRETGIDIERQLNPHGGAIALGHPYGMTGARIMGTLINDLQTLDGTLGLETMCAAGGMAMAMVIERLS